MSHDGSEGDEIKEILAKLDKPTSSESTTPKPKPKKEYNPPDDIRWETNSLETDDSEW